MNRWSRGPTWHIKHFHVGWVSLSFDPDLSLVVSVYTYWLPHTRSSPGWITCCCAVLRSLLCSTSVVAVITKHYQTITHSSLHQTLAYKSCNSLKTLLCCCSLLGEVGEMCLLYHIVRWRVNRICVDFLLIVLTWGLGSDPSTGAAQMERLYRPQKTETAARDWIISQKIYSIICLRVHQPSSF